MVKCRPLLGSRFHFGLYDRPRVKTLGLGDETGKPFGPSFRTDELPTRSLAMKAGTGDGAVAHGSTLRYSGRPVAECPGNR